MDLTCADISLQNIADLAEGKFSNQTPSTTVFVVVVQNAVDKCRGTKDTIKPS